jgi:hypothetical protein
MISPLIGKSVSLRHITRCSFGLFLPHVRRQQLSHFQVIQHVLPAQHTRHYPRGTEIGCENALKLGVKEYIPKDNLDPQPGDITIIAAHANGFPKVFSLFLCEVSGSLPGRRSFMSLSGMICTKGFRRKESEFVLYG